MDRRTEPEVVREPAAFQRAMDEARARGRRVGFVPTMGALHEGHLTLAREARARVGDHGLVAVSIFVNPTQFGPNEDFSKYPRELERDVARCATAGVDVVFAPDAASMYPAGERTRVTVRALSEPLCGPFRPGHFEGVATIVTKLFALAGRSVAVFGRKDYQQWRILSRLAEDLMLPVEVVGVRTVREKDGLAMSSRNRYLSDEDRQRASAIPKALGDAARAWERGERDASALREGAEAKLRAVADSIDYVDVRDPSSLEPYAGGDRALLAVALRVGNTRLIDNVVLGEEPAPA
ncbi:MAG: pantoate--beta-alanine ligase [Myxococcales bacterium]|nr:pantoate--beta-alanine ligase [Myxococcales bacterium]